MSKLYLDIGNSFMKLAQKAEVGWNIFHHFQNESVEKLGEIIMQMDGIETLVVSSVRRDILARLENSVPVEKLKVIKNSDIPFFHIDYDTPKTLGIDRFLVCLGATATTSKNVVVIDAGSACTIDMMTSDKIYRGGVIMPGIKQFHMSMQMSLPELPEVDKSVPSKWPGKSTNDSLQWGVNGAFIMAIKGFVEKFKNDFDQIDVFLTGGDAMFIYENLGYELSLKHRPNLLFDGMLQFEYL